MNPIRDRGKVFQLFERALAIEEPERSHFVAHQSAGDANLGAEVNALLEAAASDDGLTSGLLGRPPRAAENLIGEHYGRFRLVEFIGEGGMGVVYRAERTDGIQQTVAIKLIAQELGQRGQERFYRETQLLARLEHSAIARLIDAGVESGRAWIALEFVPGRPIDEYCELHGLPVRERVQLLVELARAVAAAHRMLVVHRDIKPANVLVTPDGSPKLIDFGIATALEHAGGAHAQTVDIGRLFTPHYAAPEQVAGEPVTVATDVFGLGALGYRLLTGRTLYPDARGTVGYLLAITQQEVAAASRCAAGHADPRFVRALRGDLDAILGKALQRDPAQRYASAADMQADLQRYLANEPVKARPPSIALQLGKFVRRHAAAVSISAVLTLVIMAAGIRSELQTRRAAEARDTAARRGELLAQLLNSADPRRGGNRDITVAQLLDDAMPQIDASMTKEPLVAASMFSLLAQTNLGLDRYAAGIAANTRAIDLLRHRGGSARELAEALALQGELLIHASRDADAEPILREALSLVENDAGADKALADSLEALAKAEDNLGREAQAESLYLREIAVLRNSREDFGGRAGFPYSGLGVIRFNHGRYAESAQYIGQALAIERRFFAKDSPDLLDTEYNYAVSLEHLRPADAEPEFRTLLDAYRRILGPDHSETWAAQQGLAHDLMSQGRYQEAADEALAAAHGLARTLGESDGWTETAWGIYGLSSCLAGHAEDGLTALRRVAESRARSSAADNWRLDSTEVHIGTCLVAHRRFAEAEPILLRAARALEASRGVRFDRTQAAYRALRDLYAGSDRPAQAAEWGAKLISTDTKEPLLTR